MSSPRAMLLCPPTYFDVTYEINPWMRLTEEVDKERAARQWRELRSLLERLGVRTDTIDPHPDYPDMVFTGDAGIARGGRFVVSNFRPAERRGEAAHFRQWFESRGFDIVQLPPSVYFEGLGDMFVHGNQAILSYGIRTSRGALTHVERIFPDLDIRARLELINERFFHIGVALAVLDDNTIMYVRDAFSRETRKEIEALTARTIAVENDDAANFAVNAIVVGRTLVLHKASAYLQKRLDALGFEVIDCDVSEFLKAGGGTRCLVLPYQ